MHFFSQNFQYESVPLLQSKISLLTSATPSHPWSHVVMAMWHKYPNSKCTHVVSIDTIDRSVDPVTGIIRTERVLGCKQKAPIWIVKVRLNVSALCLTLT